MAKKYNYDDDLAEIEAFYGDSLLEESLTPEELEEIEAMTQSITKDTLTYGEGDPVEYVQNFVFDLTDETGAVRQYEMVGRVDIEGRTYLALHRMDDTEKNSLIALRAWDDENGQLVATAITDEEEAREVYEQISLLLSDLDDWKKIPGGGVQWDD